MRFVVTDCRTPQQTIDQYRKIGYTPILLPPHPYLPSPVASHADMVLFFAPNEVWTTPLYAALAKNELLKITRACERPLRILSQELGGVYPADVLLNAAPVGNRLFCRKTSTAQELLQQYAEQICHVHQGYAKCSILPLSPSALITEDPSIFAAAQKNGVSALKVESGQVLLKDYSTGFLGGAASFAPYEDGRDVFFCGNLETHINGKDIADFCQANQKTPHSLGAFPLTDVGTMFLL